MQCHGFEFVVADGQSGNAAGPPTQEMQVLAIGADRKGRSVRAARGGRLWAAWRSGAARGSCASKKPTHAGFFWCAATISPSRKVMPSHPWFFLSLRRGSVPRRFPSAQVAVLQCKAPDAAIPFGQDEDRAAVAVGADPFEIGHASARFQGHGRRARHAVKDAVLIINDQEGLVGDFD